MNLPDFLQANEFGEILVDGHRVGLYHLVADYNQGFSPEMLACAYPSLTLATIHKVLGFYLENREDVDRYVAETRAELDRQEATGQRIDVARLRERLAKRVLTTPTTPGES